MKKTICNKIYDTQTATLVKKFTYGYFGEPSGYEETLYETPEGFYFIYTFGGDASPYTSEEIKRISKAKVDQWLDEHK